MSSIWQLQAAKNRLSELVEAAILDGTQIITRHGKPVVKVVPLSAAEMETGQPMPSLEFALLRAPRGSMLPTMPRNTRRRPLDLADIP